MSDALLTDLYQLTMIASYIDNDKADDETTFDLFIRKLPENWGYFVANGIEELIDTVTNLHFENEDIEYLREQNIFTEEQLTTLENYEFTGEVRAVKEGTLVFPNQPIASFRGKRKETQLPETIGLNQVNYQTMIASKASRVVEAAEGSVADFGLRRAQGKDAGMKGARAAYLAGAVGTSNVAAGKEYGVPIIGTHAHSFVMSFDTEEEAFRAYAKTFPDNSVLLIDTYDTIEGAKTAVKIGQELAEQGHTLKGVRLDSGDLTDLSKKVRKILDDAGLEQTLIVASNDLNEYKIAEIEANGGCIDIYGVGTELITAKPTAAIPGVYKLVEDNHGGKIKLSPGKKSYPGSKQLYRVEENGEYHHDVLALEHESVEGTPLLETVIENGKRVRPRQSLAETRAYVQEQISRLPAYARQLKVTEAYPMTTTQGMDDLITTLEKKYGRK